MQPVEIIATFRDRTGAAFGNLVFETWPLIIPLDHYIRHGDARFAMLLACVLPVPAVLLAYILRGSLGYFLAGLVVTRNDGGRVGFWRIFSRCLPYITYSINGIALKVFDFSKNTVLFLGMIEFLILGFVIASTVPIFTGDDRSLLDRITKTKVQKKFRV